MIALTKHCLYVRFPSKVEVFPSDRKLPADFTCRPEYYGISTQRNHVSRDSLILNHNTAHFDRKV